MAKSTMKLNCWLDFQIHKSWSPDGGFKKGSSGQIYPSIIIPNFYASLFNVLLEIYKKPMSKLSAHPEKGQTFLFTLCRILT